MRSPNSREPSLLGDALDLGLIVLAPSSKVIEWNVWMATASGIARADALGRTLDVIFPGPSAGRLEDAICQALEFGASSLLTHSLHPSLFPLRTRSGRVMICDVSVRPLGDPPHRQCVIQIVDATIAVERERLLRERYNARYAAVVDNAPDVVLTLDDEGVIHFANSAIEREFGYAPRDVLGQRAALLFADEGAWAQVLASIVAGDPQHTVSVVGQRKNGSKPHLEVSASRWADRAKMFVSVIVRDVTERVEAEEALKRLNETLELRVAATLAERQVLADIVEGTDAFVQVADKDFRWLAINKASASEFERIFGVRPQVGESMLDVLAGQPENQQAVKAVWSRALAGESFTLTDVFGRPDLDRRYYEMRFNVLCNRNGEQIGAYQFVYDVTERLRDQHRLAEAEEALRQSQKMEAIGQLTGGIAHDFNNLLAGIIGAMELLKRRLRAGRYEDSERFMDAAVASANRAAALTHRLLAFARRQPLDPRPLDANRLVQGMEELLRRTMGEQIALETALEGAPWLVNTDANQLENAVLNLAINARDAMPEGGRLIIATRNLTLERELRDSSGAVAAGEYVLVTVEDTGCGMPAEIMEKVFDPFFTTKPIGQGTGLGLSMVYGFAKQSGGHARIKSQEGEGTTIKLYLPRYRGVLEQRPALPEARPAPAGEGETVMLVEDDSAVRLLIGEVLRDLGYRCMEANDADTAMPMLVSNARIDLLITDVGLPRINGRELASFARKHRPRLKVLFVTGYAEHATGVERFLEPGMELVTKPFTLDALALKIRDMVAS